ncbi:jerky protein homolog-like [Schistocerca gregaria]|uniref:jerky protein homolog-like n=1 Tax=Schistocerca gregaria TaxID=7010 RepID=UPI00211ECDD4|nr:jerky protein homolog-like [Schistocerca gregaria]
MTRNRVKIGQLCSASSEITLEKWEKTTLSFLDLWKKRHGIRQVTITGEKLSADNEAAANYLQEFKDLVFSQNCSPQQVYNAGETRLNFKAFSIKSLASQEEKSAPGFKMGKQCLTVLACSSASATN